MIDFDEIRKNLSLLSDAELISIVRNHDEEQWRPEAFDIARSILLERGISAIQESENSQAGGPEIDEGFPDNTTGLDLVTIVSYPGLHDTDALTDRMALEAHGLKSWISRISFEPGTEYPGTQLKVRQEDVAAALRILESEPVPSSDLPEEIAEPPCPKCGSREVTERPEMAEPSESSDNSSPEQVWFYHCTSCGHKWLSE